MEPSEFGLNDLVQQEPKSLHDVKKSDTPELNDGMTGLAGQSFSVAIPLYFHFPAPRSLAHSLLGFNVATCAVTALTQHISAIAGRRRR